MCVGIDERVPKTTRGVFAMKLFAKILYTLAAVIIVPHVAYVIGWG